MSSAINTVMYDFMASRYVHAWAKTESYLASVLDEHCYVSFSAGKDSSVVAHLCHHVRPDIPILMVDPGVPTHWLEDERKMWLSYAEEHGWHLRLFPWDKWRIHRDVEHLGSLHRDMFADLRDWADSHGLTTRVMGLRADESKARLINLRMRGKKYTTRDGRTAIVPIATWTNDKVWSYIISHSMPWLDIYDRLGPEARNGLIGINGMERGRMIYLKRYYPKVWEQAKTLILEAQDYV